jgi:hypothetical protein
LASSESTCVTNIVYFCAELNLGKCDAVAHAAIKLSVAPSSCDWLLCTSKSCR